MVERRTVARRDVGSTPAQLLRSIERIASEVRTMSAGVQADDLEEISTRLRDAVTPPRIGRLLTDLRHPLAWLTRETSLWLVAKLELGAEIVEALIPDGEITGSPDVARAREWVASLGLKDRADVGPGAPFRG